MRYISECVLSSLELAPPRTLAKVFRIAGPMFYEFNGKKEAAMIMAPDSATVLRRLLNGRLLFRLDPLIGTLETLELKCVRESRAKLGKVGAFEFEHRYVSRNPSVFYLTTLPEFCYCDEDSITTERDVPNRILWIGNRQNVIWLSIGHEARRELQLRYIFYGPDEKEFKIRRRNVTKSPHKPMGLNESIKVISDLIDLAVGTKE